MELNPGDLFVVTRGFKLGKMPSMAYVLGIPEPVSDGEPTYDRSYEGRVLKVLQVCGPVIAAEIVYDPLGTCVITGYKRTINTREVEIWPVTPQYLDALREKKRDARSP